MARVKGRGRGKKRLSNVICIITIFYVIGVITAIIVKTPPQKYNLYSMVGGAIKAVIMSAKALVIPAVITVTGVFHFGRFFTPVCVFASAYYLTVCSTAYMFDKNLLSLEIIPGLICGLFLVLMTVATAVSVYSEPFAPVSVKRRCINKKSIKRRLLLFLLLAAVTTGFVVLSSYFCGLYK